MIIMLYFSQLSKEEAETLGLKTVDVKVVTEEIFKVRATGS